MPRFILPGADELSCADGDGRAFSFPFPYDTESPTEIALLRKHGAQEVPVPRVPKPEPVKLEPPAKAPAAAPKEGEL
jgi:hypothetical protein